MCFVSQNVPDFKGGQSQQPTYFGESLFKYTKQIAMNNNRVFRFCVFLRTFLLFRYFGHFSDSQFVCIRSDRKGNVPFRIKPASLPDQTQGAGSGSFVCKMWERARAETVHAGRGNGLFATDHAPVGTPVTICNSLHNQSSLTMI